MLTKATAWNFGPLKQGAEFENILDFFWDGHTKENSYAATWYSTQSKLNSEQRTSQQWIYQIFKGMGGSWTYCDRHSYWKAFHTLSNGAPRQSNNCQSFLECRKIINLGASPFLQLEGIYNVILLKRCQNCETGNHHITTKISGCFWWCINPKKHRKPPETTPLATARSLYFFFLLFVRHLELTSPIDQTSCWTVAYLIKVSMNCSSYPAAWSREGTQDVFFFWAAKTPTFSCTGLRLRKSYLKPMNSNSNKNRFFDISREVNNLWHGSVSDWIALFLAKCFVYFPQPLELSPAGVVLSLRACIVAESETRRNPVSCPFFFGQSKLQNSWNKNFVLMWSLGWRRVCDCNEFDSNFPSRLTDPKADLHPIGCLTDSNGKHCPNRSQVIEVFEGRDLSEGHGQREDKIQNGLPMEYPLTRVEWNCDPTGSVVSLPFGAIARRTRERCPHQFSCPGSSILFTNARATLPVPNAPKFCVQKQTPH